MKVRGKEEALVAVVVELPAGPRPRERAGPRHALIVQVHAQAEAEEHHRQHHRAAPHRVARYRRVRPLAQHRRLPLHRSDRSMPDALRAPEQARQRARPDALLPRQRRDQEHEDPIGKAPAG